MQTNSTGSNEAVRDAETRVDKKRLKALWAGLSVYFVIMVVALQYATRVPSQILALGGLLNMTIVISFFVAINKARRRIRNQGQIESKGVFGSSTKYAGLKKVRWLFFALAAVGIAGTPSAILTVLSNAASDHRLAILFVGALVIRLLFIGFFLKIWWEAGKKSGTTSTTGGASA